MAEACFKSDEYTEADVGDREGWRPIVLCRVLTGRHHYTADVKPNVEEITQVISSGECDSVLGDREKCRGTFREFIIFDDSQVYPEWLIWYRRRFDQKVDPALLHPHAVSAAEGHQPTVAAEFEEDDEAGINHEIEYGVEKASGGPVDVIIHDGRVHSTLADFETLSMADLQREALEALGDWIEGSELHATIVDPNGTPGNNAYHIDQAEFSKLLVNIKGMKPGCVVLLMPQSMTAGQAVSDQPEAGSHKLKRLRSYFRKIDQDSDGTLCRGEVRALLWKLQLTDVQFSAVFEKFDVRGNGVVELDELMYLVGAQFLENKESVKVEELMLQAAETLLKMELHKDVEMGALLRGEEVADAAEDGELGHDRFKGLESNAKGDGAIQAASNNKITISGQSLLLTVFFVCLLLFLILDFFVPILVGAAVCAGLYWVSFCFLKKGVNEALSNAVEGMEEVLGEIEKVQRSNPVYSWHIECWHMETVSDKDGKTRREKRVTHRNTAAGEIPAIDKSDELVPNTSFPFCAIACDVSLDFSQSNYTSCFNQWVAENDRDQEKSVGRKENLPGVSDILACWVKKHRPWWLSIQSAACFHLMFCGPCHRLKADAAVTHQNHVYRKICQNM